MTGAPVGSQVAEAITTATALLALAEVPSPAFDAAELAAHAGGVQRRDLWRTASFPAGGAAEFERLLRRRLRREPLQHILGRAWFRHVELAVGPGVFVPRPETEVVAGAAIDELPDAHVHAVELGGPALGWAERNLAGSAVDLRRGDMADAFHDLDGTVEVVVSNPPYIPVGSLIRDPEVAEHDPALALWSGADGLDALRVVSRVAMRLLRPGGLVVVEHADLQGGSAPAVLSSDGWSDVRDHLDLAGRPRYVTARRPGGGGPPGPGVPTMAP